MKKGENNAFHLAMLPNVCNLMELNFPMLAVIAFFEIDNSLLHIAVELPNDEAPVF